MASLRGRATQSSLLLIAGLVLAMQAGCQADVDSREFSEKTTGGSAGLLPGPPDGEIEYSEYEPETPHKEIAPGLLSQTAFDADGDTAARTRYQVEARNLLVGPGKSTEAATLPGGAVFEVRSGTGSVTIGENSQEITTGATFAVSKGESFRLANSSEMGLALRVYVIRLRQ